uniref:MRH domain-containing protein n=1 Tax=Syphacia muris TaxID=451379 RepID=A0A0N5AV24_9BILA
MILILQTILYAGKFFRKRPHLIGLIIVLLCQQSCARNCTSKDYVYEYTTCDANGQRWKVSVPVRDGIKCDGFPAPVRGINCSFSCDAGMYLDVETQECRQCQPGSYSLGSGVRFDEFTHLPAGFIIENIDLTSDGLFIDSKNQKACSSETGWLVKNSELLYVRSPCLSKLTYSVNLVRPGYVEYVYHMPKNSRGLVLDVTVKNEQCQNYREQVRRFFGSVEQTNDARQSSDGDWQRRRVPLHQGANVITWTVANSDDSTVQADFITIARIDIIGIAFTKECTLCAPGTYSNIGASECKACPAGYFSTKGSAECGRCSDSQYSGPRSAVCIDRPVCTEDDYYMVTEPCKNGKTRVVYKIVQPNVCNEELVGSFKLPKPGPLIDCPKCNPGMSMNSYGECVFCPLNHFSDGNVCKKCPVGTQPNYGFQYVLWHTLPANMESRCEYIAEESNIPCNLKETWLPTGNDLRTAKTYEKGIVLELLLDIKEGFSNPLFLKGEKGSAQSPVARITLEFETRCADESCIFYFVEESRLQKDFQLIADFNGTQTRRSYSYSILSTRPLRFVFAFMRSRSSLQNDAVSDQAIIYSINVTNVAGNGGGASACLKCPTENGKCVVCPAGEYISDEGDCKKCPKNTVLNSTSDRIGTKSCIPCGLNLKSDDGITCTVDGILELTNSDNSTNKYNLTKLANRTFNVTGVKVFAREGSSYFHSFNFTLFPKGTAKCAESLELLDLKQPGSTYQVCCLSFYFNLSLLKFTREVEGFVCRSTALERRTLSNSSGHFFFVTPLLLGDELVAVTQNRQYGNINLTDQLLDNTESVVDCITGFSDTNSSFPEIRLFYRSSLLMSEICPNGYFSVITARCDPQHSEEPEVYFFAGVVLPRECPDATCDGCVYHFIIVTSLACPICTNDDYKEIRGECVDGTLTIHRIPARQCILSGGQSSERTEPCSVLSFSLRMFIFGSTTTAIVLFITVAHVCRKNKSLEYKYTKLAESKGGNNEYLPSAETCGINDDDDEEINDRVFFAKGKKRFFGIGQSTRNDRIDDSERKAFVSDADDG